MKTTCKKVEQLMKEGVLYPPIDGNHGEKHPKTSDYVEKGIPFILVPDLKGGSVDLDNCNYISEAQARTLSKGFSITGDVLFTHKATIGEVALVDTGKYDYIILTPQVTYYRIKDPNILSNRYLFYYFQSQTFINTFRLFASSGGTRDYLGIVAQQKLPIIYPGIDYQNRIADILQNYDQLISNNNRRIKVLEQMAENLYKEWFVRFRFPGYDTAEFENGIPKGWEHCTVESLSSILQRGISPDYDEVGELTVISQKCIRQNIMDIHEARKQRKTFKPELNVIDGDTVICSTGTGTLGRVGQIYGSYPKTTFDSHVTLVRAKEPIGKNYLYWTLKQMQPWFMSMGIGSTNQQELYRSTIKNAKALRPDNNLITRFEEFIDPIHREIISLKVSVENLVKQRDLLLPRLMSGKLEAYKNEN